MARTFAHLCMAVLALVPSIGSAVPGLGDSELDYGLRVQTSAMLCVEFGHCLVRLRTLGLPEETLSTHQQAAKSLAAQTGFACNGTREPCYALAPTVPRVSAAAPHTANSITKDRLGIFAI
mmetsp:Transcript_52649/g.122552  ORF Transcript_52649/g.122552 Transcript_52649/m.122552 type:complete len:121 (+) Transcript_52649:103-465(+)